MPISARIRTEFPDPEQITKQAAGNMIKGVHIVSINDCLASEICLIARERALELPESPSALPAFARMAIARLKGMAIH